MYLVFWWFWFNNGCSFEKYIFWVTGCFKNEPGTLKNAQVTIPSANPKFYRVRPVPCALKSKIENDIGSLVKLRIYPFVTCDRYLVPPETENILAIINGGKVDEPILICGD